MQLYMNCQDTILFLIDKNHKIQDKLCCSGIAKNGGTEIDYVLNNTDDYLNKIFKAPFKIQERYTGKCDDQITNICNKTIYFKNVNVVLGTLGKCNAKCDHCIAKQFNNDLDAKLEENLTKLLANHISKRKFVSEIQLSGTGEATMYNLENIIESIDKDYTGQIILLTNGSNTELLDKLLAKDNRIRVRISIVSLNKLKLEQYYHLNHYDKLMSFLTLWKWKSRIEINWIGLNDTINEFNNIYNFCKKYDYILNVFTDRYLNTKENIEKIKKLQKLYPDCNYRRYKK